MDQQESPKARTTDSRVARRRFLRLMVTGLAGGAVLTCAGAGWTLGIEPYRLVVERITVPLRRLPISLDGLHIAQLSDLHAGPYIQREDIARAVKQTLALQTEIIVLTGDFVTRGTTQWEGMLEPLRELRAPLGVYAILGNHDYWVGAEGIVSYLEGIGITVLRNAARRMARDADALWLVGLDDVWASKANPSLALFGVPLSECMVLLVHEPDFVDWTAPFGVDLQLSGHSHGGQVRLPGIGPLVLPRWGSKYPAGLERVSETWIYTNRGIGMSSPPIRFNCPPEITLLTLRHDAA